MIGERISWRGVNSPESGIIEQEARIWVDDEEIVSYEVRMDDGKYTIVNEKSIIR